MFGNREGKVHKLLDDAFLELQRALEETTRGNHVESRRHIETAKSLIGKTIGVSGRIHDIIESLN